MNFLCGDNQLVKALVQVPNIKGTLGIFLTQRTSLFHSARKGLNNEFGGFNDWVAGLIPPLVD